MSYPGDVIAVAIEFVGREGKEIFKCSDFLVADGELRIWTQYRGSDRRYNEKGFPQTSILYYEVERDS